MEERLSVIRQMTYGSSLEELSFGTWNKSQPPHLTPTSFPGSSPPGLVLSRGGALRMRPDPHHERQQRGSLDLHPQAGQRRGPPLTLMSSGWPAGGMWSRQWGSCPCTGPSWWHWASRPRWWRLWSLGWSGQVGAGKACETDRGEQWPYSCRGAWADHTLGGRWTSWRFGTPGGMRIMEETGADRSFSIQFWAGTAPQGQAAHPPAPGLCPMPVSPDQQTDTAWSLKGREGSHSFVNWNPRASPTKDMVLL